jgi:hypothetical protein
MSVDDLTHGNGQQNHKHRDEHEIEQQHDDAPSNCAPRLCLRTNSSAWHKLPVPRKAPTLTPLNPAGGAANGSARHSYRCSRRRASRRILAFGQCETENAGEIEKQVVVYAARACQRAGMRCVGASPVAGAQSLEGVVCTQSR